MPKKHTASLTKSPQTPTKKKDSHFLSGSSPSGRSPSSQYRNSPSGRGISTSRPPYSPQRRTPPPSSPKQRHSPRVQGQRKPPPSPRHSSSEVGRNPNSNQSPGRGRGRGRGPGRGTSTGGGGGGGGGGRGGDKPRMMTSSPSWLGRRQAPPRDFSFADFNNSMHVVHDQFGDTDNSMSNHHATRNMNSYRRESSERATKSMFFGHESTSEIPDLGLDKDITSEQPDDGNKSDGNKNENEVSEGFASKESEQRFVLELGKLGIAPTVEYDEEEEMKKPQSDLSIGDESYILDLARQKEKRKKDLQEEALEDALVVYKKELKEGQPESDERFLAHVVVHQGKLQKQYKNFWKEQDTRLADALQAELDRRTKESTLTIEVDDDEIAPDSRGSKGQRISAFIAKEKDGGVGNSSNGDIGEMEDGDCVSDKEYEGEGTNHDEERSEDTNAEQEDNKSGEEDEDHGKAKETAGKRQGNDEPVVGEGSEKVSDRSLVTIDLVENREVGRENGKGNCSKSTNETMASPDKSSHDVLAHSNDGDLIAMEEGGSGERNKRTSTTNNGNSIITAERKKRFTRCILVGICAFFVFDAALLVLFFLRD